ncbi:MAG: hypothetical protein AABW88_00240 [Nanoarchaeota archaeon]
MKINIYPKNKKHFIKLKSFCKEIIETLNKTKINPVAWGGLVYFAYTKDKSFVIHDIDLLIPDKSLKKAMKLLKENKAKYKYISDWHYIAISKGNLRIDLDPLEWYCKKSKKFNKLDFNGLEINAVNLKDLINIYERASKRSKDKPGQHKKRLEELRRIKA